MGRGRKAGEREKAAGARHLRVPGQEKEKRRKAEGEKGGWSNTHAESERQSGGEGRGGGSLQLVDCAGCRASLLSPLLLHTHVCKHARTHARTHERPAVSWRGVCGRSYGGVRRVSGMMLLQQLAARSVAGAFPSGGASGLGGGHLALPAGVQRLASSGPWGSDTLFCWPALLLFCCGR